MINGVAALSPADVWAVGRTGNRDTSTPTVPVIVHWDGHAARPYAAFAPTAAQAELSGIAAIGVDDIWAVGSERGDNASRLVVMHWNSRRWRVVPTPRLRGGAVGAAVAAIGPNDVWVVGASSLRGPVALNWNGRRWKAYGLAAVVPDKAPLIAIDGTSPGDVWAVGTNAGLDFGGDSPVVVHWDGHRWTRAPIPRYDAGTDAAAVDVAAAAPHDVWMLADNVDGSWHDAEGHYITRYDGRTSRVAATYFSLAGSFLEDIAAVSPTNLFLVGPDTADYGPVVSHSNGRASRLMRTPFDGLRGTMLSSISVLSPTDIWAAGDHLLARYSC